MSGAMEVLQGWFHGHGQDALAPEVVFRDMTAPDLVLRGPAAVEQFLHGFYGAFEASGARPARAHAAGEETVVMEFTFWGRNQKKALGAIPPAGKDAELPICAVYQVRRGKIDEITIYYNAAALITQLG
ncbi:MAG TPA: ester cyclase [Symbiobacteriaceae bacterium]|nr:ester cyclase [Symbiobacteriaceae bacterium]